MTTEFVGKLSKSGKHKCRDCHFRWSDYDRRDGQPCRCCGSRRTIVIGHMDRDEHMRRVATREAAKREAKASARSSDLTYEQLGLTDADFGWYENE